MKIYDISQPVMTCVVFPGDPAPESRRLLSVDKGDVCNLTAFSMCAHNGTHIDAPFHFLSQGKRLDQLPLDTWIGPAWVVSHNGEVSGEDARAMLETTHAERLLIRGKAVVTQEAAAVFAQGGLKLVGNESQTVGPENAPKQVHLILLGAEVALLEGIRLAHVPDGEYLLNAAPLNLGAIDGAPCRAVLMKL